MLNVKKADFVDYTSFDAKQVELTKHWSDVVSRLQSLGKQ